MPYPKKVHKIRKQHCHTENLSSEMPENETNTEGAQEEEVLHFKVS